MREREKMSEKVFFLPTVKQGSAREVQVSTILFREMRTGQRKWGVRDRVARCFVVQYTKTGETTPNDHNINPNAIKYTKWPENRPNGHKIYQYLPFQDPPKFTQIVIFGLENKPSGNPGARPP
jgi:hypothetical protein